MSHLFNWAIAEELAAAHMRFLGMRNVRRLPDGPDGGVDVVSTNAIAQVKDWLTPVGIAEVQRLRGTLVTHDQAIFYARNGFTASATEFAVKAGVALFRFSDTLEVIPINLHAKALEAEAESAKSEEQVKLEVSLQVARHMEAAARIAAEARSFIDQHKGSDWIETYQQAVQPVVDAENKVIAGFRAGFELFTPESFSPAQLESLAKELLPAIKDVEKRWDEVWDKKFETYVPPASDFELTNGIWLYTGR